MAVENKKISDLTATSALGGAELLVAEQNGAAVSVTADRLANYAASKVKIPETTGFVKSVNGVSPDKNGNVEIEANTTPYILDLSSILVVSSDPDDGYDLFARRLYSGLTSPVPGSEVHAAWNEGRAVRVKYTDEWVAATTSECYAEVVGIYSGYIIAKGVNQMAMPVQNAFKLFLGDNSSTALAVEYFPVGDFKQDIPEDENIAISKIGVVLTTGALTTTLKMADGTESVITGTLDGGLVTNLNVDGTDIPVSMEGF